VIVFVASIAVPVLKIGVLALLAWSSKAAPQWRRLERARLYRLIEAVGHWSMLDVYVVVLLGSTVRFGGLASAHAEPGLLAFAAAESIEPGRTEVRYKEVAIGKVQSVALRDDRKHVIVTVQLDRASAGVAVDDTAFWVVRPRIGVGGVTGLGTLLSGAYIGAD